MSKVANYRGVLFHEMKAGSTIYYRKMENGYPNDYLCEVLEVLDKTAIRVKVLSHSHNGNEWRDLNKYYEIKCKRSNAYLIDEDGVYAYFDALGRPVKRKRDDRKTDRHPSYAMINISRFSGGHNTYFGSSIKHDGGISIKISPASVDRSLSRDWYHAEVGPFIHVEMSYTQFSEMLTSGMNASGVPCTLRHINGINVEPCEFTNKKEKFGEEFNEKIKKMKSDLAKLVEDSKEILSAKKAPNKGERGLILKEIANLERMFDEGNGFSFLASQWDKQLTQTVVEAKGEIEGFMETKIRDAGIKALVGNPDILKLEEDNAD